MRSPTSREQSGDFSQSGVTIYDPLTTRPDPARPGQYIRTPFPGNVIPPDRISPVARNMAQYWPEAGAASAELVDRSITGTFKLDQLWSPSVPYLGDVRHLRLRRSRSLAPISGTARPRRSARTLPTRATERSTARCTRSPINNTITPNQTTVAHVRLGYTSFADDCVPTAFDPGTLGFSPSFVSQVPVQKFPYFGIGTYGTDYNGYMFGDRPINDLTYYSWDANASMSKLMGKHTVKFGASYRQIGAKNFNPEPIEPDGTSSTASSRAPIR